MKLDRLDLRILSVLQREGRITKVALAERVNLSPTPCWERLRRLENEGYIAGYRAEIALDRLFKFSTVMVEVALKRHRFEDFERFEAAVRALDAVVDCFATGGGIDYMLRVVANDIDSYQRLIDGLLEANVGIDRYFTYIVTRTVKTSSQIGLSTLLELQGTETVR